MNLNDLYEMKDPRDAYERDVANSQVGMNGQSRADVTGEEEPGGVFTVMIDGRPWKTGTSNKMFELASRTANKHPDKKVAVKWPTGELNTVRPQGVAEGSDDNDTAKAAYMYGLRHGREGVGNNMDRAQAEWGNDFKYYNAGFLKGRNEKAKGLKAVGQGHGKKQQGVAEAEEQGIDNKYRRAAKKMINVYNTNPEIKAKIDASTKPLEAMVYTTGVIKNPDRLTGTTHMNKLMTELESIYYYGREQGVAEGSGESYIIVRTDSKGKKDVFAGNFDTYERAQKELDGLLAHPLHTKYKQKFEIKQKGGEQGMAEGLNEFVTPQAVAQDPGLEREKDVDVIFFGVMPQDFTARTAWKALEDVLPREYPAGSERAQNKIAEVSKNNGAVVTTKPLGIAQKLVKEFLARGIKCRIVQSGLDEGEVAEGKKPGKSVTDAIQKILPITQEIWFHGSRAIGKHRKNSDTDILVVVPDDLVGDEYLAAVRILQKLSSHFDNYDIQPTKSGTNIHRIAQEEGRLLWSNNQGVAEGSEQDDPYKGTTPPNGKVAARNGHKLGKTYNNPHSPKYHKDSYAAWDRDYNNETSRLKNKGVAEGHDSEDLANEVYAEFERIYPNLARRVHERTIHAAIMDVLNYGGDNDPGALAQDVARAVKQQMQQGVAEAEADSDGHSVDHADSGEYDYEGDQARDQMNTIVRAARRLDGLLDDNENMPEWVQMKVTLAADYLDTAADYIESNQEPELAEGDRGRGRPPAGEQDTTPITPGRVEKTATGIRHHADASRYGGTEPDAEDDHLMSKSHISRLGKMTEPDLDEGDKIGNMDADKFDAAMARLKQLAGAGPLKTVYDPTKRVYRNVPVAVQPKK